MNRLLCGISLAALLGVSPAWANFTITQGSGTTVVSIDSTNQGTSSCAVGSTECPATILMDSTGTILSTTSHVLNTNAAISGSISNTSFGISGTLPAFAATPTVNLGTLNGAATQTTLASVLTAIGTPMQASGGSVTANAGTNLNTSSLATDAHLTALTTALGSPFQAGGNVGVTATVLPSSISSCTAANGSPISGTPTCQGVIVANTNANLTPGDAISTSTYGAASPIIGASLLWNGTTYDRWKEGAATGIGLVGGAGTAGTAATNVMTVQGIASMTPFLSNPGTPANWGIGAIGSAAPANAQYSAAVSSGNLAGIIQGDNSAPIAISSATTTQVVALSSGKKTYITGWDVVAAGAGTVQLEYGTGTNCATVVGTLTGAYPLAANGGLVRPSGLGPALIVPASDEVCVVTTASATAQGSITYTQF